MADRPINDISFRQFLQEKKLMGSLCTRCNASYLPPRPLCVQCWNADMKWIEFDGLGKLAAFTCIAIVPPSMAVQGYGRKKPYCSGVVELPGGFRVDARILGVDPTQPENIKVGMPVRASYLHSDADGKNRTYLAFEPL